MRFDLRFRSLLLLLTLPACANEFTRVLPDGSVEHEFHLQHVLAPEAVEALMRQSATRAPFQISMVSKDQSRTLVLSGDQAAVRATIAALHEIDVPKR